MKRALSSKDRDRATYNMLLIGETGSGKTSFLNLLYNFQEVLELRDDTSIKKLKKFHDKTVENANAAPMESKTTGATYYQIDFQDVKIGAVDTPGFGDTRGLDHDKENVKKIVDKLNEVEYINCICLIINGRVARMTHQLQYVVSEISAVLPKATATNIVVVFTNVKDANDVSFEIDSLAPYRYLGTKLPSKNVVYIDNPWCTLQKMEKTNITKDLTKAFSRASESLEKMFNVIQMFEAIHSTSFMQVYLEKEAVERKMVQLLHAVDNKTSLQETIATKKAEIDAAVKTKSLNKGFVTKINVPNWVMIETPFHNTVCQECNANCHQECGLKRSMDREVIKECSCIMVDSNQCSVCGHSYDLHVHMNGFNMREMVETDIVNNEMKKKFESAENEEALGFEMKKVLDKKYHEMETEVAEL